VFKVLDMLARITPADSALDDPFWHSGLLDDRRGISYLMVSPDPAQWGEIRDGGMIRVLDPREVVHA